MECIEAARGPRLGLVFEPHQRNRLLRHGVCNSAHTREDTWPLSELAASKTVLCF